MKHGFKSEIPGLILTGARYGIAEHVARRVKRNQPVILASAALVAADVLDGVILRKFDADTPIRRTADGIVDHASVARIFYELGKNNTAARPYIAVLAARAMLAGGANLMHYAKTGETTRGKNYQRGTNLATAAFGIAAVQSKSLTHLGGIIASGIALATLPRHFEDLGETNDGVYREF